MYSWPTYQVLDHEGPFGPHLSHKVVDVKIIFLLQSLHHCINSNECASSAHTSTVKEQHPTSKHCTWSRKTNGKKHIGLYYVCNFVRPIVHTIAMTLHFLTHSLIIYKDMYNNSHNLQAIHIHIDIHVLSQLYKFSLNNDKGLLDKLWINAILLYKLYVH